MRVLLTLHHRLLPDAGAPGATLALGEALEGAGCSVDYYDYDRAFQRWARSEGDERVDLQVRFPWLVAAHLTRRAENYDVVDASVGDTWVWAAVARAWRARGPALVTRSHGLEQIADERRREAAPRSGPTLSWKYPIYHGGYRLWEARRSLQGADHCLLLNSEELRYVRERMRIAEERSSVVANGLPAHLLGAPDAEPAGDGPVQLAFIGRWTTYKGRHTLLAAVDRLESLGIDYRLLILGTGHEEDPAGDFAEPSRSRITVIPRFENHELPEILGRTHVYLFPSLSEGSSLSLLEAMGCGLCPVVTAVGAAPDLIDQGRNGFLVAVDDDEAMATAVARLAADRAKLDRMRAAAQSTARTFGWEPIARQTVELYRSAREGRSA